MSFKFQTDFTKRFFAQLFCLLAVAIVFHNFAAAQSDFPALQNQKAVDYLKQNNLYDSLTAAVAANPVFAQQGKLTANDGLSNDNFGFSVAVSGDTAIVGSPRDQVGTVISQGSAYIYVRTGATWTQQQKLTASDPIQSDQFGYSVAINGNTAAVGRYNTTTGLNRADGKVYIFTRSGNVWTETQTLASSDLAQGDLFGNSLAFDGDTLVVGALSKNIGSNFFQGAAYVFTRPGASGAFAQQQRLIASDGAFADYFGYSVAISGDSIVVGSIGAALQPNSIGRAYVFTRSGSTWTQQQKLTASDGAAGDFFGYSVGISGDTAVIGAPLKTIGSVGSQGAAYVFTRSGSVWTQQQRFLGVEAIQRNDSFGYAVAVRGDTIAVGSPAHEFLSNIANHGAVYVFTRSGAAWSRTDKLLHDDPSADALGQALAFDGSSIIAGAPAKDSNRGATYVFNARASNSQSRLVGGVDLVTGAGYGNVVAVSNDTALTGSLNWGTNLFVRNGDNWEFVRKLSATVTGNDTAPFSNGGAAIVGDTMFVGSPTSNVSGVNAAGAVYVFNRVNGNWVDVQRIVAPESTALQSFGNTLAISGDTLAIGAANKTVGANQNQGAIYVYVRTNGTWTFQQKLTAADGSAQDFFGQSLALSGDTILAGAPMADINGNINQGATYVFTRSGTTWSLQQKLSGSDCNANDNFGFSVALDGNFAVIGAPFREVGDNFTAGVAYVLTRAGAVWTEQQRFNESGSGTQFARSLALSAERLVIGQAGFNNQATNTFNQGAIYVYNRSGSNVSKRGRLVSFDGTNSDQLGFSVGISGNYVIGGAVGKRLYGQTNLGAGYVFDLASYSFGASAASDFDGDGKADLSVFRGGNWYFNRSSNNQFAAINFGLPNDFIVPADYDGDGKTDVAVFRNGIWYFQYSATNQFTGVQFGLATDTPVPADYDGDGKTDIAVFRDGVWYRINSSTNQFFAIQFGIPGDKPARGDYDGDGKADLAVYRAGNWFILNSSNNQFRAESWGLTNDKIVPGDYDGDGKTDLAVFRDGNWYVRNSSTNEFRAVNFGLPTDVPVPADYDGDGKTDVAVFRNGIWYVLNSSNNGFRAEQFGVAGDVPTPSTIVR